MISFQIEKNEFQLQEDSRIEDIYLFGSCARKEQDEYSDIDLLVVVEDCADEEYEAMKIQIAQELQMPLEWISLYQLHKIQEMGNRGSYFLWHIKLEGIRLYTKRNFLDAILEYLPEYQDVLRDLDDYSVICNDIRRSLTDEYLDVPYELSVLASVIRNTAIAIDFLYGEKTFGRMSAVETCNHLLKDRMSIPVQEYVKLYTNRLYITKKSKSYEKMTINDIEVWLDRAERLISCAKEAADCEK